MLSSRRGMSTGEPREGREGKFSSDKRSFMSLSPSSPRSSSAAMPSSQEGKTNRIVKTETKLKIDTAAFNGTQNQVSKKRKRPFRIKKGCIVALRFRPGGNHVTLVNNEPMIERISDSYDFCEVWTDPMPGRDEGLALIGRRIRCRFPKSSVGEDRSVEGEVISILDYEDEFDRQRHQRRQRISCGTTVELLVDQEVSDRLSFLEQLGGPEEDNASNRMSSSEKKLRNLEDIIRGKNKVSVKIRLADSSGLRDVSSNDALTAKWVIRKRVVLFGANSHKKKIPTTTGTGHADSNETMKRQTASTGSESLTRYIGDGHDSKAQQERNFRWLARRLDDSRFQQSEPAPDPSFGIVGEVLRVIPSSGPCSSSLATVTMRRMVLPEHTKSGRMSYHGLFDVFDCTSDRIAENGDQVQASSEPLLQVPVEEVVIIHRRLERVHTPLMNGTPRSTMEPVVSLEYSLKQDLYKPTRVGVALSANGICGSGTMSSTDALKTGTGEAKDVCHRCRKAAIIRSKKRVLVRAEGEAARWGYFCENCHNAVQALGKEKRGSRFGLPCDCRGCSVGTDLSLESMLEKSVEQAEKVMGGGASGGIVDRMASLCSICGNTCRSAFSCAECRTTLHKHCMLWDLSSTGVKAIADDRTLCRSCRGAGVDWDRSKCSAPMNAIGKTMSRLSVILPVDFELPFRFINVDKFSVSSLKAFTKTNEELSATRASDGFATKQKKTVVEQKCARAGIERPSKENGATDDVNDEATKPVAGAFVTCSRSTPYEPLKKRLSGSTKLSKVTDTNPSPSSATPKSSRKVNIRAQGQKRARDPELPRKKSTSRAARATQRRMMKDVASIGASGLEFDLLAGREQQLRFDRSSIHAWGVFADMDISAGDMVVEYRGELIGNAVAEKRENEYELAKIGSDYMFRIDAFTVCDATKQGNVARFINASCDPNCYTQIVTLNGVKRIVIYAKKDIQIGTELCYDYKFAFEFDETRRIECHCGASNCRGFMNWDRRYVSHG